MKHMPFGGESVESDIAEMADAEVEAILVKETSTIHEILSELL